MLSFHRSAHQARGQFSSQCFGKGTSKTCQIPAEEANYFYYLLISNFEITPQDANSEKTGANSVTRKLAPKLAPPGFSPAKPYLLFKTAESNNYLRQFAFQDPWIESLSVSLCSSRPLARPPARPSFLGNESTSHIIFWAKPKANAHLSNGFVKFLHFNLYLVMCHKIIMTDTSVQGITDLFRTLGKSMKIRVRLMHNFLAFGGGPPSVGGHVKRSIFWSRKWTPNWVHGAVGFGGVALISVAWAWNGRRAKRAS